LLCVFEELGFVWEFGEEGKEEFWEDKNIREN